MVFEEKIGEKFVKLKFACVEGACVVLNRIKIDRVIFGCVE